MVKIEIVYPFNGVGGETWDKGEVRDAPDELARREVRLGRARLVAGEVLAPEPPPTYAQVTGRMVMPESRDPGSAPPVNAKKGRK